MYVVSKKKSVCQISNCGAVLAGNLAANLEQHMQRLPKVDYETFLAAKKGSSGSESSSGQPALPSKKLCLSSSYCIPDTLFSTPLKVNLDANSVMNACIELVTVNGRPFGLMDDSGFRKIIGTIENAIGKDFRVSAEIIRSKVPDVAASVRDKIKMEAANRFISLKIDCATRSERSVIGINM